MKLFKQKSLHSDDYILLTKLLGGIENIDNINRCSTRMRIVVKNNDGININDVEKISFVKGAIIKENIIQLIVEGDLNTINKEYLRSLGIFLRKVTNIFDVKLTTKKNFFKATMDGIGVLITPLIPYLITLAIVLTISNIFNVIEINGQKLSGQGSTLKIIGEMLVTLQNALTLAFSILIPWSIFKMMNGSQAFGICIGVSLCAKDLYVSQKFMESDQPLFSWVTSKGGEGLSFGELASGYPWKISYKGQIIPLVMIGFLVVYIERLVKKIKYGVIKELIGIPMVTIISFFVGILLLAPIGMMITYGMNIWVLWGTTNKIAKYIFNPIFGLLLPWLVVTGFIQIFVVINLQQFATYQATSIMPMFTQLNVAVATSVFAFSLLHKSNKELQKEAIPSYLIAYIGGTTEPALFGISLRFLFPVIATSIGATVGILITTASGVITTMGAASLLIFLSTIPQALTAAPSFGIETWPGTGFLWMTVALGATIITTFLATILLSRLNYFKISTKKVLERDFAPIPIKKRNES